MSAFALTRNGYRRVAAAVGLFAAAVSVGLAGQPPEVEDPKGGAKKRIVVADDLFTGKSGAATPAGNPPDVQLDELVRAAESASSPALKAVFARHAVPFDRLILGASSLRVKPVPLRRAEWPNDPAAPFDVTPQDDFGKPRDARRMTVGEVKGVEHYELIVQAQANSLLKEKADGGAARSAENAAAAEKLLAAGLRFHDYARDQRIRRGKSWDDVRAGLAAKLREVRLGMLRAAVAANDAQRVREAGAILIEAYAGDMEVAREVAGARVREAGRLLTSPDHADHVRAKQLIDEFEVRFPGAGSELVKQVRQDLRRLSASFLSAARSKQAAGDLEAARADLARASALDPSVDGVRDMQRELRFGYPILQVGVRQFPLNMSPATARTDAERQAVELMFEGLLEEVPNADGSVGFRPGVAREMPAAFPGGREFLLRAFEKDASARAGFATHDLVGTVKMLGERPETWQSYPLPWLAGLPTPRDETAVRVNFGLGHPDPRSLLTFKLLPARYLADNGLRVDDAGFAEKPFGTGPFRLLSRTPPDTDTPREMVFVDNPGYGRWQDRAGLPNIREVRFVQVTRIDPVSRNPSPTLDLPDAFRTGRLHILTDIPTADIEKFTAPAAALTGRAEVVTAAVNRRVHVLAVNLTRPNLQNKALRQMLSMAIDREKILNEVFRAGKDFHRVMSGPYPPGSWAESRGQPLYQRDAAVSRLRTYLSDAGAKLEVELAFPVEDPLAEEACRRIKAAVEDVSKDVGGDRKFVVNLLRLPMSELLLRVGEEHNRFDLAYVPFDYPDDWYPFALGAALEPQAAVRGGRNWFHFLTPETNPDPDDLRLLPLLNSLRKYSDVSGTLAAKSDEAGKLFNDCLPFIPLWQLDRHMVVSTNLKVYLDDSSRPVSPSLLNPTTLFQGIARWKLE